MPTYLDFIWFYFLCCFYTYTWVCVCVCIQLHVCHGRHVEVRGWLLGVLFCHLIATLNSTQCADGICLGFSLLILKWVNLKIGEALTSFEICLWWNGEIAQWVFRSKFSFVFPETEENFYTYKRDLFFNPNVTSLLIKIRVIYNYLTHW